MEVKGDDFVFMADCLTYGLNCFNSASPEFIQYIEKQFNIIKREHGEYEHPHKYSFERDFEDDE